MKEVLKREWNLLLCQVSSDVELIESLWKGIERKYSEKKRAYHNLSHIHSMLIELAHFESEIEDIQVLKFSIWYHDLIYNAIRKDNEMRSARLAKKAMQQLGFNQEKIDRCYHQIMLTKTHQLSENDGIDERYMVDFDLEVLSRDWDAYKRYGEQIRKEYWMYPLTMFRKGRRAALGRFLEREFIYQTDSYRESREVKARANIIREIKELS